MARTQALAERGVPVVIYDAALLIENKLHEAMDGGDPGHRPALEFSDSG